MKVYKIYATHNGYDSVWNYLCHTEDWTAEQICMEVSNLKIKHKYKLFEEVIDHFCEHYGFVRLEDFVEPIDITVVHPYNQDEVRRFSKRKLLS